MRHYAAFMRQVFHQTRENPQLQALATVRMRGYQRECVAPFLRHATSEVGHDQLALNDFAACGFDPTEVPYENPHPATSALLGFAYHQIYNLNPVGYLGYLFFLEFLPTSQGGQLIELCKAIGVPGNAFTFLEDHVKVDVGHNRAMKSYCEQLLCTEADIAAAVYAVRATGYLYEKMLDGAIEAEDAGVHYGRSWEEAFRRDS